MVGAQTSVNKQPALTDYIAVYQKYISAIRGGHCQMYPSCSNFGMGAFKQQNPLVAITNTSDRLLRCSHDHSNYSRTHVNGRAQLLDLPNLDAILQEKLLDKGYKSVLFYNTDTLPTVRFINALVAKRCYREALLEINRVLFFNDAVLSLDLYANYLVCKRALNEMEDAVFAYNNTFPEVVKNMPFMLFEFANLHTDLGNYQFAISCYEKCKMAPASNSILIDKSNMLIGLAHANLNEWDKSKAAFNKIGPTSHLSLFGAKCKSMLDKRESYKFKKPALAGALAVVPGLGYFYAGHKKNGCIVAFGKRTFSLCYLFEHKTRELWYGRSHRRVLV